MGKRKSPVKIDLNAIIIAIITLIGTLGAAYFISRGNIKPTEMIISATETAQAKITFTVEPSETFTSLPTNTNTFTPTFTETPSFTPNPPTNTATKTPTKFPTSTPIPPAVFRGFDKNCISKTYWNPTPVFPSDNLTLDSNGCWNLTSWGVLAENQNLKFAITDDIFNERVTRSIYTSLGNNVVIEFKINVKLLTSSSDMDGVVFVGLGNKTSYAEPGYFLKYIVLARETTPYFVFAPDYFNYYIPKTDYKFGEVQSVKIVINGSDVSVQVGNQTKSITLLPSKREVLWIGYSTPASNNYVNAIISDFRIYDK